MTIYEIDPELLKSAKKVGKSVSIETDKKTKKERTPAQIAAFEKAKAAREAKKANKENEEKPAKVKKVKRSIDSTDETLTEDPPKKKSRKQAEPKHIPQELTGAQKAAETRKRKRAEEAEAKRIAEEEAAALAAKVAEKKRIAAEKRKAQRAAAKIQKENEAKLADVEKKVLNDEPIKPESPAPKKALVKQVDENHVQLLKMVFPGRKIEGVQFWNEED